MSYNARSGLPLGRSTAAGALTCGENDASDITSPTTSLRAGPAVVSVVDTQSLRLTKRVVTRASRMIHHLPIDGGT